jgi:hypothetical protein
MAMAPLELFLKREEVIAPVVSNRKIKLLDPA